MQVIGEGAQVKDILGNPAFLLTFAVVQAGVLLLLVRLLDRYDRQPLVLVLAAAAWGAIGATGLSIAGNEAVKGMLSGEVRIVFGDAIVPPVIEEAAKGLALLIAVGPIRWLAGRAGVTVFQGVGAGLVFGAAVGVGFAFTEDVVYLVDRARAEGVDAGFETFVTRRDFFGPAILHHAAFTAAFGAGLGLAVWSRRRSRQIGFALGGFALAVLLHAVNNGLVELVLVLRHGIDATAAWLAGGGALPEVDVTADRVTRLLRVIDFAYLLAFAIAAVQWTQRQRRAIAGELAEEVEAGLVTQEEVDAALHPRAGWELLRSGQLERWRHQRRVGDGLARLGLLKWRTRRFGGDWSRVQRARRELATLATYEVAQVDLPVPAGPLVGRDDEVAEIRGVLGRTDVRLVTLTGPGGTGKTRLSIEVASQDRERYASGVVFVELAALTDPELVPGAIGSVLGVQEVPGEPALERLADHLRDRHLLLVLDNFEQVTGAAPAIAQLLSSAPRLSVLATSREPLRIAGEHEVAVHPLGTEAAVALFCERAGLADPSDADREAIAEVCRRLDGLPLAIELAAARTNVLTPKQVLQRLGDRLDVLGGGSRDLPERHQALRRTIDWSHELLSPAEQALFARLGVFAGGASLEAIEAVCGDGLDVVLDGLGSLVDKSLVRRIDGAGGEPRFTMLETIRAYAVERLQERGEESAIRERQAANLILLAETAAPLLAGADQAAWAARLDQESANVRAALAWSLDGGSLEHGLRIAGALPRFWSMRGSTEGPRWLAEALRRDEPVDPLVRARALFADGYAGLDHGEHRRARERFETALELARELGESRLAAGCLAQLGFLHMADGDHARAAASCEESVELALEVGDAQIESVAVGNLAAVLEQAGDLDRARGMYERSLTLRRSLGDRRNIAGSLLGLGRVELLRGEPDRAETLVDEGLAAAREVGDAWTTSVGLSLQGRVAMARGDRRRAEGLLRQALELTVGRGGLRLAAECLDALGTIAPPAHGAMLWGAADAVRERLGVAASAAEAEARADAEARAREALGDAAYRRAHRTGLDLELEDAVGRALAGPGADAVAVTAVGGPAGA